MLGLVSMVLALSVLAWLLGGGPGYLLRGAKPPRHPAVSASSVIALAGGGVAGAVETACSASRLLPLWLLVGAGGGACALALSRIHGRHARSYVRLQVVPYRTDVADEHALVRMFSALHARLVRRWWQRLLWGQSSVGLEIHHRPVRAGDAGGAARAWLVVTC